CGRDYYGSSPLDFW
nr:immunoglobulin heavy chain junction region [Mus musculus]